MKICCSLRLTHVLGQRWEFVDVFTGVLAARHAEAELKVETFEQPFSEIMSLDHPEVFYRPIPDCELHSGMTGAEQEERVRRTFSRLLVHSGNESRSGCVLTHVAPTCRSRRKAGVNW